jgi:hypothetical protein
MRLASALCFSFFLVAGCSTTPGTSGRPAPYTAAPRATEIKAIPALVPGKSTKADVLAALGKTTTIAFDSGHEVWIYLLRPKTKDDSEATEFVLLFAPSGVLAKTRTRGPLRSLAPHAA